MNPDFQRVKALFLDAAEKPTPADRRAFLDEACAGNVALRAQVKGLLDAHDDADGFLAPPAIPKAMAATEEPVSELIGTFIGPYKLIEQIGEGGMGLVFMAEQKEPVRRKVALKLIKPGMDSKQVIARFNAERQALALMDHPNIAKILDAGTTQSSRHAPRAVAPENPQPTDPAFGENAADGTRSVPATLGRPYFVMELIHGIPITDYCDRAKFTIRKRLELFVQVCRAVQHAHTKGIIHRDLKPGNVLVTSNDVEAVPKIIDFGVAKALDLPLTEQTLNTGFAQMLGTPLYMSPEQAEFNQGGVDTRSDIYSLGVLLYELLTGTTPLDRERLRQSAVGEVLRLIREEEPRRPSACVSTLGANLNTVSERRSSDPRTLQATLQGEIDWIVLKALEKDRARRYQSASALADDVERFLKDEPVEACPPSLRYRVGKFVRRHRVGLAFAALISFLLIGGGAVLWRVQLRNVYIAYAVESDFKDADKLSDQQQFDKARQVLERAKDRLEQSGLQTLQEQVENRLRDLDVVARLEDARAQGPVLFKSREVEAMHETDRLYGVVFAELGLRVGAADVEASAENIRRSTIRVPLVAALDYWAIIKDSLAKGDGQSLRAIAQAADDDAWRQEMRNVAKDRLALERLCDREEALSQPPTTLLLLYRYLQGSTRPKGAARPIGMDRDEQILRQAQLRYPNDFWINYTLASHLQLVNLKTRRQSEAISFYRAALALQPRRAMVYHHLGLSLWVDDTLAEAADVLRRAVDLKPDYADAHRDLGSVLMDQRNFAAAEAALGKAIALTPNDSSSYNCLGQALALQKKWPEAIAEFRKAIEHAPRYFDAHLRLGNAFLSQGSTPEAIAAFRGAVAINPKSADAHNNLGVALEAQGDFTEAVESYLKASRFNTNLMHPRTNIAVVLFKKGKLKEGEAAIREIIKLHPDDALAYLNFGVLFRKQEKLSQAETALRKAIKFDPKSADAPINLGETLRAEARRLSDVRGNAERLRASLDESIQVLRKATQLDPSHGAAHLQLGLALLDAGKLTEGLASLERAEDVGARDRDLPSLIHMADQLVALEKKLPKILKGEIALASGPERLALAFYCRLTCRRLHTAAARFYANAFAADAMLADDLDAEPRYDAACASAMAAGGFGHDAADLTPSEKSKLRSQALAWLRADLTARQSRFEKQPEKMAPSVQENMQSWQLDWDLSSVRDEDSRAALPESEQRDWQMFWQDVADLQRRAAAALPTLNLDCVGEAGRSPFAKTIPGGRE